MFTGIVEATGEVREVRRREQDAQIVIGAGGLDLSDVKVGDSIAVNGCCLTVVELVSTTSSSRCSTEGHESGS